MFLLSLKAILVKLGELKAGQIEKRIYLELRDTVEVKTVLLQEANGKYCYVKMETIALEPRERRDLLDNVDGRE